MSSDQLEFVCDEEGNLIVQEGKYLAYNRNDGSVHYVDCFESTDVQQSTTCSSNPDNNEKPSCSKVEKRFKWSREATLLLIHLKEKFASKFESTTQKNDSVWRDVAAEMQSNNYPVTSSQCHDKWKYLKIKYNAKKDNMSCKSSGSAPITFEFFEQMDRLLGKKHSVTPLAVAASLQGDTVPVPSDDEENQPPPKKLKSVVSNIKQNKNDKVLSYLQNLKGMAEERERNRAQRHEEILQVRNRAIDVFSEKMDAFLKQMKSKDSDK